MGGWRGPFRPGVAVATHLIKRRFPDTPGWQPRHHTAKRPCSARSQACCSASAPMFPQLPLKPVSGVPECIPLLLFQAQSQGFKALCVRPEQRCRAAMDNRPASIPRKAGLNIRVEVLERPSDMHTNPPIIPETVIRDVAFCLMAQSSQSMPKLPGKDHSHLIKPLALNVISSSAP